MDELEISGKRYLSSRRAAKQYHYHSDYIGQLIRSGKVVGTKVGRAWYVDAESLETYLSKENTQPSTQEFSNALVLPEGVTPSNVLESSGLESSEQQSERSNFEPEVESIATEKKDAKIQSQPDTTYTIPIQKVRLTYVPDEEPLFPAMQSNISPDKYTPEPHNSLTQALPASRGASQKRGNNKSKVFFVSALVVTATSLLAVLGSNFVATTVTVQEGKPASVVYSLQYSTLFHFIDLSSKLK
ncbi:MAG: helix-turn-helix domain-containing protein [bacterium]|nr:helix-turn-helix domain-containing protein [bacterium]